MQIALGGTCGDFPMRRTQGYAQLALAPVGQGTSFEPVSKCHLRLLSDWLNVSMSAGLVLTHPAVTVTCHWKLHWSSGNPHWQLLFWKLHLVCIIYLVSLLVISLFKLFSITAFKRKDEFLCQKSMEVLCDCFYQNRSLSRNSFLKGWAYSLGHLKFSLVGYNTAGQRVFSYTCRCLQIRKPANSLVHFFILWASLPQTASWSYTWRVVTPTTPGCLIKAQNARRAEAGRQPWSSPAHPCAGRAGDSRLPRAGSGQGVYISQGGDPQPFWATCATDWRPAQ